MNLHSLKNTPGARQPRKRAGRGEASGWGKTAGRGNKGYHSRAGSGYRPTFEGGQMPLVRRMPKVGFKSPTRVEYRPVNVASLNAFEDGAVIDVAALRAVGLVRGSPAPVKILGTGELKRKLTVRAAAFSASAKAKIEAAGGACEIAKG